MSGSYHAFYGDMLGVLIFVVATVVHGAEGEKRSLTRGYIETRLVKLPKRICR